MSSDYDAALYGAYCDYSGRAHSPIHDPAPSSGSPALDELVGVNPEEAAFSYVGDMGLRKELKRKWPALKRKAAKMGLRTRGVTIPKTLGGIRILGDSAKVIKGRKLGVITAVLYMSPATEAWTATYLKKKRGRGLPTARQFKGLCKDASPECMAACLGHGSGHLAMDSSKNARIWKSILYMTDKPLFMKLLASEVKVFEQKVKELKKTDKRIKDAAVRLDGATDLGLAKQLAWDFPKVKWYDYTKDAKRVMGYLADRDRYEHMRKRKQKLPTKATKKPGDFPPNWHLTFSYSGRNLADSKKILRAGGNVAVVFDSNAHFCDPIPEYWEGFRTIDADETDVRYKDPRGRVAALRFKKAAGRLEAMRAAEPFLEPISGGRKGLMVKVLSSEKKAVEFMRALRADKKKYVIRGYYRDKSYGRSGGWHVEYKLPTIAMHPRPKKNAPGRCPVSPKVRAGILTMSSMDGGIPYEEACSVVRHAEKDGCPECAAIAEEAKREADAYWSRQRSGVNPPAGYLVSPGENVFGTWPFLLQHIHGGQSDPVYALSSRLHAYGSTLASREELDEAHARFAEILEANAVSSVPVFSSEREYLEYVSAYEDLGEFIRRASVSTNPGRPEVGFNEALAKKILRLAKKHHPRPVAEANLSSIKRDVKEARAAGRGKVPTRLKEQFGPVGIDLSPEQAAEYLYSNAYMTLVNRLAQYGTRPPADVEKFFNSTASLLSEEWQQPILKTFARANPRRSPIEEAYLRNVAGNPRRVRTNPLLAIVGNPGHQCSRCGSFETFSAGSPYAVGSGAGRTEHVQVVVCGKCGQEDHAAAPPQSRVAGASSRARVKSRGPAKRKNPKVKKNRVAAPGKKKKQPKRKRYDLEEGRERFEGYDEAYDAYTDFHGNAPAHVEVFVLDDGKDEVRVEPIHAALHRTLETNYVVPWESSKRGTLWLHEHKEGHGLRGLQKGAAMPNPDDLPLEVYDPATKTTRKLGGQFQVKDWWYD